MDDRKTVLCDKNGHKNLALLLFLYFNRLFEAVVVLLLLSDWANNKHLLNNNDDTALYPSIYFSNAAHMTHTLFFLYIHYFIVIAIDFSLSMSL